MRPRLRRTGRRPALTLHPLGEVADVREAHARVRADLEVLGQCLVESLDELVDASSPTRTRAPRGRVTRKR